MLDIDMFEIQLFDVDNFANNLKNAHLSMCDIDINILPTPTVCWIGSDFVICHII